MRPPQLSWGLYSTQLTLELRPAQLPPPGVLMFATAEEKKGETSTRSIAAAHPSSAKASHMATSDFKGAEMHSPTLHPGG